MLLELFQLLKPYISGFNLFGYLTLRAILAAITALVVSLLVGPSMIRKLAAYKVGRHADHGRHLDLVRSSRSHAAVGRSA